MLAEFSISLAGFTSIVIVFVQRGHKWRFVDEYRVKNAMLLSVGSAFMSFVPILLSEFEMQLSTIWKTSSLLMIIYCLVFAANRMFIYFNMDQIARKVIPLKLIIVVMIIIMTNVICQVSNFIVYQKSGFFMIGIVILLFLSFLAFLRSMFYRPDDSN